MLRHSNSIMSLVDHQYIKFRKDRLTGGPGENPQPRNECVFVSVCVCWGGVKSQKGIHI